MNLQSASRLRQQQQLPNRLSPFQIAMRLLRLRQRISMLDTQLQLLRRDHSKYARSPAFKLFAARNVIGQ